MLYASTKTKNLYGADHEVIVVIKPLDEVPGWDPDAPPPSTYLVPDDVEIGWVLDTSNGTFAPPPDPPPAPDPPPPDPLDGFAVELYLDSAVGGELSEDYSELNLVLGQQVIVTGYVADRHGQIVPLDASPLRLPLLQADIYGQPLPHAQPSMAAATISAGEVTATWTPEFTGIYAITQEGINVRLPDGHRIKFGGLTVYVSHPRP